MTPKSQAIVLRPASIANALPGGFAEPTTGGDVTWKTLFSAGKTPSDTLTTGIATCAPKGGHLKCHRHTHPEIYHVIRGQGVMSIDGEEHFVEKGSVVFIPGDSEHGITNWDEDEDLTWLYVFAADRFEDVVYRFSDDQVKAKL